MACEWARERRGLFLVLCPPPAAAAAPPAGDGAGVGALPRFLELFLPLVCLLNKRGLRRVVPVVVPTVRGGGEEQEAPPCRRGESKVKWRGPPPLPPPPPFCETTNLLPTRLRSRLRVAYLFAVLLGERRTEGLSTRRENLSPWRRGEDEDAAAAAARATPRLAAPEVVARLGLGLRGDLLRSRLRLLSPSPSRFRFPSRSSSSP